MDLRYPSTLAAAGPLAVSTNATRPLFDVDSEGTRELALGLIGVIGPQGRAVGPWAEPSPTDDELLQGLRDMVTLRAFDSRMQRAHRQGKTSFYMQSLGEEAIACGHRRALAAGDMNFPTYRQPGLLIADGYPLVDMMNQVFSNAGDPLLGRQLPVFYSSRAHGFFSISGNLGTQFVQAVGWAMAAAIAGDGAIASAWIGDGATAESDFHAALVFASTYNAPVILNVVNNQWAISTHEGVARGQSPSFASRGVGYGIPSLRVDGNDYLAVRSVSAWAAARARGGHGPTLIEWVTYRVGAHSTSDDPSAYRSADDAAAWPLGDPIERLEAHLVSRGIWDDQRSASLREDVAASVAEAAAQAERLGTLHERTTSDPSTIFDDVYAVPPPHLTAQRRESGLA